MRRALAVLILTASSGAPVQAATSFRQPCTVVSDPAGDTRAVSAGGHGADIVGARAGLRGSRLHLELRLRSLPSRTASATYSLSWMVKSGYMYGVSARHEVGGWQFASSTSPSGAFPVSGSVSPDATITFSIPIDFLRYRTTEPIGPFWAEATIAGIFGESDTAPDNVPGFTAVRLDAGCRAPKGAAIPRATCAIGFDRENDAGTGTDVDDSQASDLLSIATGANQHALRIDLNTVEAPSSGKAGSIAYEVRWELGRRVHSLWVWVTPSGLAAQFSNGFNSAPVVSFIDRRFSRITIVIPLELAGIRRGDALENVRADSYLEGSFPTLHRDDLLASESYTVGNACTDASVRRGALIVDAAHDELPAEFRGTGGSSSADIVAVGAATDPRSLILQVRVSNLRAAGPPGFEEQGWTVSWYARGGARWIAQAQRSGKTWSYRVAARSGDDETTPSAPLASGVRISGVAIDNLITMQVPRFMIGSPPEGAMLPGLAAISFAARTRAWVTSYVTTDVTGFAPYLVGADTRIS